MTKHYVAFGKLRQILMREKEWKRQKTLWHLNENLTSQNPKKAGFPDHILGTTVPVIFHYSDQSRYIF